MSLSNPLQISFNFLDVLQGLFSLSQQALAEKCDTNKAYISKSENNLKEVRLSTLQRIIEQGLGGKLEIRIGF